MIVLDNSVVMRWYCKDGSDADLRYAKMVRDTIVNQQKEVPALSKTVNTDDMAFISAPHLLVSEAIFVLHWYRNNNALDDIWVEKSVTAIDSLNIKYDTGQLSDIHSVSKYYQLSGYDATYLELAIRLQIPLATNDKKLRKAAKKAQVAL